MPEHVPRRSPIEVRFWSKVAKTDNLDDCWLWTDSGKIYGKLGIWMPLERKLRYISAHRLSYELAYGPVPKGLTVDHTCRNKRCVNPRHLEAVTSAVNTKRHYATVTHCKQGHPLAGENLRYTNPAPGATGHVQRVCRVCQKLHMRKVRAAKRQAERAAVRFLFVGERPSKTAKDKGWTWTDGRLAAKQLFDGLKVLGFDPSIQSFCNLFYNDEDKVNPAAVRRIKRAGLTVIAMGRKVAECLDTLTIPHLSIVHPAAWGKIRAKKAYTKHLRYELITRSIREAYYATKAHRD